MSSELLKSFNQNEKFEQTNDPKFPLTESDEIDNDVQIRRNRNIHQYRYSKTTDFDFGRKHSSKDFDIKACAKIHISNESSPIKLRKNEIIKYQNGHFYRADENSKTILRPNVTLKSARLLNKRDVELRDSNNLIYVLFFESSKDAKLFIENEKVSCYIDNDNKSTITKTLLRLLGKRSSREVLEKKGIYQNEPIFGNTLRDIYRVEKGVPRFILRTIELIERPENITSLGLYRTSGNLATIQKIRFEVDKGRLDILNEFCKDVDVLTGSLKLFFRELKEPLIPCHVCDTLLEITKTDKNYSKKDRDKIRSIISKLPEANFETLLVLIAHLIKVVRYKEENKMDTYNLSVCWGPTIIFITDNIDNAHGRDIVAQSTDATRLFDALLMFYMDNPEELHFGKKKQDYMVESTMQRQDSKDSMNSSDSNNSKKKSGSNLSLNIDEVLKKSIEIIEFHMNSEGLYKKSGSNEKISKIMKKMTKKKVSELDKYKYDVHELTDCLKKYVRELSEPLATKEVVDQVNKFCDNTPCLEQNNRHKIIAIVEDLPKKDTLIYLVRHIIKVMEHESYHNVSKSDMTSIWTNVLNYQKRITESNENFSNFLRILLEVFDETKPDVLPPRGIANGLLNDLKNYQKDKDRCSKYDNVPETEVDHLREATIPEEKTEGVEYTKL
ncbi:hypothetical protein NQ318_011237 [Aromia moschata]|uniref:Rho-GAP domain-containing protein n=1 Tax=Aromia moschata TaxID=1265417 RepID=A0AAV8YGI1_9CUCU|nr:hypothetical protein NQ318_011237 [Aromia moschata]